MFRCKCTCRPLESDSQEKPIRLAIKHLAQFPSVSPVWFTLWTDLLYVLKHTNLLQCDWLKYIRTSTICSYSARVWSLAGQFLGYRMNRSAFLPVPVLYWNRLQRNDIFRQYLESLLSYSTVHTTLWMDSFRVSASDRGPTAHKSYEL